MRCDPINRPIGERRFADLGIEHMQMHDHDAPHVGLERPRRCSNFSFACFQGLGAIFLHEFCCRALSYNG
jgi:hypothetical protein